MSSAGTRACFCLTALLIFALDAGSVLAQASIKVAKSYPTQDEPVQLTVTDDFGAPVAGAEVVAVYRPGSSVSREESIGRSDASGMVNWTPSDAGLATITATWTAGGGDDLIATTTVSVRFSGVPINGIIIMILAGFLLVVGSIIRIYKLVRAPEFN
jgi:hypothetical protein